MEVKDMFLGTIYRKMTYGDGEQLLVMLDNHLIPTLSPEDVKAKFGVDMSSDDANGFKPIAILINPEVLK